MRVVMTLLVKDEADIIDAQIAFHLAAGVDFVIATDHESRDDTVAILERYAAQGVLHVLRESGDVFSQSRWVTRMARLAATEFGADWVINSDADEFWWPSGGSLKQVLSHVPPEYGIVQSFVRAFLPPLEEGPFAERMIVRLSPPAAINDPSSSVPSKRAAAAPRRGGRRRRDRKRLRQVAIPHPTSGLVARRGPPLSGPGLLALRAQVPGALRDGSRAATRRSPAGMGGGASRPSAGALRTDRRESAPHSGRPRGRIAHGGHAAARRTPAARCSARPRARVPPRDAREQAGCAVERAVLDESELVRLQRFADRVAQRAGGVRAVASARRGRPRPRARAVRSANAVGRRSPPAPKIVMTLLVRDEEDILPRAPRVPPQRGRRPRHRDRPPLERRHVGHPRVLYAGRRRGRAPRGGEVCPASSWQTRMARLAFE